MSFVKRNGAARRWVHHAILSLGSVAVLAIAVSAYPAVAALDVVSIVTAWLCLLLLGAALLVGPWAARRGVTPPLNNYLRRDIGIWAACHSLVHLLAGTAVAMSKPYYTAFVTGAAALPALSIREQLFNAGSIVGLVAGVVFLLLLLLSFDAVLRWLGPERWKRWQRSAIPLLWLTALHGAAFQVLEGRYLALVLLILATLAVVVLRRGFRAGPV